MLFKRVEDNRNQFEMIALDKLVPEDHLVRKIDQAIRSPKIYEMKWGFSTVRNLKFSLHFTNGLIYRDKVEVVFVGYGEEKLAAMAEGICNQILGPRNRCM